MNFIFGIYYFVVVAVIYNSAVVREGNLFREAK